MGDRPDRLNHSALRRTVEIRLYAELNDFVAREFRKRSFVYQFTGQPSIKDAVEAIGVPHTEIDLLLVNGESVNFSYLLRGRERVAVYPVFEGLDISPVIRLRPAPLRVTRFVADVHLGRLARHLRLLGFDTVYRNNLDDSEIVAISLAERRIVLTRDRGILKHGCLTHGYWVRSCIPREQVAEVIKALQLESKLRPFTRCSVCNGCLTSVDKAKLAGCLPPRVAQTLDTFFRCEGCGKVYWRGSHVDSLCRWMAGLRGSRRED
ncbi:MAG: Mut7-C ubiquitin/RNAse domain-containing protein [Gammaproteobacteria bacterium]|nr:Mut7-C ubiquitin/RNAse domain-containing protein [Gammaproteobacteria bacterium]